MDIQNVDGFFGPTIIYINDIELVLWDVIRYSHHSRTHTHRPRIVSPLVNPCDCIFIYLSAIQQWCKMKMAVGIVVRFFLFWSRHVYTPIVFSRWPYFHKRKIHTFLRKPFCLAYKFFSSFYFIANIVDIEHYTHQAKLSSMFTELDFF